MRGSVMVVAVALAGCASLRTGDRADPASLKATIASVCPYVDAETRTRLDRSVVGEGGVAITLETWEAGRTELRRCADAIARLQDQGGVADASPAMGAVSSLALVRLPPSRVVATDWQSGARIIYTPRDPAALAALRASLRDQVQRMQGPEYGLGKPSTY